MTFPSILYLYRPEGSDQALAEPDYFVDLNLDQIVSAIIADKDEYELAQFFYAPLTDVNAVLFRQAAMQDVERPGMLAKLQTFARHMHEMRAQLARLEKRYNPVQRMRWFLDTVLRYCETIRRLDSDLQSADLQSQAFQQLCNHVAAYAASEPFGKLANEAKELTDAFAGIRYNILIQGLQVTVSQHHDEADYSKQVEQAFANFDSRSRKAYPFDHEASDDVDGVEAKILEQVVALNESVFGALVAFCQSNQGFSDPAIAAFDREVQFYIAYLNFVAPLKKAGLSFCYPQVSSTQKAICARDCFDLALAIKLSRNHAVPVCNEFHLDGPERIVVVSGPNQGGKTTFARTLGQLHHLAGLGCPVAASQARLFLADRIFTHFERVERMTSLRGKLQDDLIRVHDILTAATPQSLIIINEIFSSTTLEDAMSLSRKIADAVMALDALGVWVTFIEEIASLSEKTVSMVSTVVPEHPEQRTFRILRQPADGLAYAMSIARKYRLTRDVIRERIGG